MGKFFKEIGPAHQAFIAKQKMFFVASAPLSNNGHVNVSPKGMDCFRILSPAKVIYMDIVGSGNETSAHILENGRITLMFCAFDGPPNILRLYGQGYTVLPGHEEWDELSAHFGFTAGNAPNYSNQCAAGTNIVRIQRPLLSICWRARSCRKMGA
jgi:hypothetical protein